ncbi:hypothetical protein STCU_04177 [Strigomonas culicis]|uniref:RIIa domain-containing protein n=1 Tax=Strigomonas culicis TaxID=28005 RepID=S9UHD1_9TRYP|nr:hypothetical protein STCU_04177 [Strigomonas culicis]|eukprot:EPY30217.1 hypothetical protein STCU_04177 [Strigomonas culicis]
MSVPAPVFPPQPSVREAAEAVFLPEETQRLKANLIEEQIQQARYLRAHPEIERVMRLAVSKLVREQPEDPVPVLAAFLADDHLSEMDRLAVAEEEHQQWMAAHRKSLRATSQ